MADPGDLNDVLNDPYIALTFNLVAMIVILAPSCKRGGSPGIWSLSAPLRTLIIPALIFVFLAFLVEADEIVLIAGVIAFVKSKRALIETESNSVARLFTRSVFSLTVICSNTLRAD